MAKITLKAARVNAGMTQEEVEKATGIPASHVSLYESGKRKLPVDRAFILCKLYGVTMDDVNFLPDESN